MVVIFMKEDQRTSQILTEIADMSRELQRLRLRVKWVRWQMAVMITLGAVASGLVVAVSLAGHVGVEVATPAH